MTLIAFEGIDASGKHTQAKLLKKHLEEQGEEALILAFPTSNTKTGKMIYDFLHEKNNLDNYTVALLFAANRSQAQKKIKKALEQDKTVIADRYYYSNYAFMAAKGISINWLKELDRFNKAPEKVFLLDLPAKEAFKRKKDGNKIEHDKAEEKDVHERDTEYLEKVRQKYLELASGKIETKPKWIKMDATKKINEIHKEVKKWI